MSTNKSFVVKNGLSVNTTAVFDSSGNLIGPSSAGVYANGAFAAANTADQRAVTSGSYANSAYSQANTATTNAATADQRAVTSGVYANAAFSKANTSSVITDDTTTNGTRYLTFTSSTSGSVGGFNVSSCGCSIIGLSIFISL